MDRTLTIKFDARTVVILGAVLVMLATWLPWSSLPSFLVGDLARHGFAAGGLLTFALSLLALLGLLLPWRPLNRVSLLAAVLAMFINLVALVAFVRVIQLSTSMEMDLGTQLGSLGSGMYLTFAGAWLMLFGGLSTAEPWPDRSWPGRSWLGYAAWGGLLGILLAACLCAWSIGLILRPMTLASPSTPAATFGPAPTAYMATPLVDVQLEPLGGSPAPRLAATPTPTRPGSPTVAPAGQNIRATASPSPSPTTRRGSPAASPTTAATTPLAPPTLPSISTSTPLPATATLLTATVTATHTPTPTTFTSPLGTPTPTATPTGAGESSATPTATPTPTVTPPS